MPSSPGNKPPPEVRREGVTVHIDGAPALWLESPIATRPQDWTEAARRILFPEKVRR